MTLSSLFNGVLPDPTASRRQVRASRPRTSGGYMSIPRSFSPSPAVVTALGAILIGGCTGDRATRPDNESAAFNFTNGPTSPGMFIVRIANAGSRVISTDPVRGLLAIHGTVKDLAECTNASTRVPVDIQIVATPSDAQNIALLLGALDNDVAIYDQGDPGDLNPFDPAKFCPFISTVAPIYDGVVHYRLHINGQGSLNFEWEGFVTRVGDGATFPYVERQHFVSRGDGTGSFVTEDILVQSR
jgi:hypothetical protein